MFIEQLNLNVRKKKGGVGGGKASVLSEDNQDYEKHAIWGTIGRETDLALLFIDERLIEQDLSQ